MSVDKKKLDRLLSELETIQGEHAGKGMPADVLEKFGLLAREAKALQEEADREQTVRELKNFARTVPDPLLPASRSDDGNDGNGEKPVDIKSRIAGYMTIGDWVTCQPAFKQLEARGFPKSDVSFAVPHLLKIKGANGLYAGFVPMGKETRALVEKALMETKDLATFGTHVIEPDRLPDFVKDVEDDQLRLRDVLNVSQTTSNLIQWVARESFTRAAAIQSEDSTAATQGLKPQAGTNYVLRETTVKTIGVWIPVTEQQLQDAPQLINLIQQDLLYDVRKAEEEGIVWGDGTALELDGLADNITEVTAGALTTNIDLIRHAITEIRVSGYEPNAVAIHPEEWEGIEIEKGSDGHYIWAVIRDLLGPRIWGLRVVETVAMQEPAAGDRIIIVGDFRRGATLLDKMQASIAIGWIDDQFIRNMRTIRAEERIAFAVRRPLAFRKITMA